MTCYQLFRILDDLVNGSLTIDTYKCKFSNYDHV